METDGVGRVGAAAPNSSRVQWGGKLNILNRKKNFDFMNSKKIFTLFEPITRRLNK
jgi:hypothetical protein